MLLCMNMMTMSLCLSSERWLEMEQRYVDSENLSHAIKKFLCGLIEQGKDVVEITEFNAELQKIIRRVPVAIAIEWIDAARELPVVSDEYLVRIAYADKPTVLHYDADEQMFFCEIEGETVYYKVTHWAELPEGPSVK